MSDREERARQLIERARPLHSPSTADAARVRAALGARIAAEPLLVAPDAPAAVGTAASGLGKLLAVFAAGSSLGLAAGLYVAATYGEPRVVEVVTPAPSAANSAVPVPMPVADVTSRELPAAVPAPRAAESDLARAAVPAAPRTARAEAASDSLTRAVGGTAGVVGPVGVSCGSSVPRAGANRAVVTSG